MFGNYKSDFHLIKLEVLKVLGLKLKNRVGNTGLISRENIVKDNSTHV